MHFYFLSIIARWKALFSEAKIGNEFIKSKYHYYFINYFHIIILDEGQKNNKTI